MAKISLELESSDLGAACAVIATAYLARAAGRALEMLARRAIKIKEEEIRLAEASAPQPIHPPGSLTSQEHRPTIATLLCEIHHKQQSQHLRPPFSFSIIALENKKQEQPVDSYALDIGSG